MYGRPVLPPSPAALPGHPRAGDRGLRGTARSRCAGAARRARMPPCPGRCWSRSGRAAVPTRSMSTVLASTVGSPYSGRAHGSTPLSPSRASTRRRTPREPWCPTPTPPRTSARPPSAVPRCGSPACPAPGSRPSRTAARPSCAATACASRCSTATPSVRTSPRPAATPATTAPSTSAGSAGSPNCSPATACSSWSRRSRRSATSATRSERRTRPTARSTWRCTSAPPWRWRRSGTSRVSTPASAWVRSPG